MIDFNVVLLDLENSDSAPVSFLRTQKNINFLWGPGPLLLEVFSVENLRFEGSKDPSKIVAHFMPENSF